MAVDLHTHSRYSDGSDTPAEVVGKGVAAGLSALALTDHDLLDGIDEARAAAGSDLELVPGTEISVEWRGRAMHLLAYWVEDDSPLKERLEEVRRGRIERNREMVQALIDLGIDTTISEIEDEAGVGVVGRPHFAAVLVRKGVVETISEAFDQYLATGRPAYRARTRIEAAVAIDLAWRSGAVPVVAHPHTLADNMNGFADLFPAFADLGVAGVECHYVEYPQETRDRVAALAEAAGLVATGGSDYHGTYKPGVAVGVGTGDLRVPDSALEGLESRRRH